MALCVKKVQELFVAAHARGGGRYLFRRGRQGRAKQQYPALLPGLDVTPWTLLSDPSLPLRPIA